MEFKWLSDIKGARFLKIVDQISEIVKDYPRGWTKKKILDYIQHHNYDCLLGFEKKDLACWRAVNKDRNEGVLKGFMIYTFPQYRGKGYAAKITAELARRAYAGGFKFAQLGLGRGLGSRVLASTGRNRKRLGVAGFSFNSETGKVIFPAKRAMR